MAIAANYRKFPEALEAQLVLPFGKLLRRSIHGPDAAGVALWHQQWRAQQLSSEQLVDRVIRAGWLQPLFHHWLRLQGPAQARGIRLNNLDWFDFKSAWLAPEVPTRDEMKSSVSNG